MEGLKIYKVFVYGSLKRNFPNHFLLCAAKFLGEAISIEKYALVDNGFYPYACKRGIKKAHILGEIYEVNENILKNLDILEGYPVHYKREKQEFIFLNGLFCEAFIYYVENFKPFPFCPQKQILILDKTYNCFYYPKR